MLAQSGLAGVLFEATSSRQPRTHTVASSATAFAFIWKTALYFEPVRTGIAIALALRQHHGKDWDASRLRRMLGDPAVRASDSRRPPPC